MSRIGVFVCHCGHNIAGTVDVTAVAEQVQAHSDVVFATDYRYMCSDPGQQVIRESIAEYNLDGVVVNRGRFIVGESCMNCHSHVHGSNHPSGANLLR